MSAGMLIVGTKWKRIFIGYGELKECTKCKSKHYEELYHTAIGWDIWYIPIGGVSKREVYNLCSRCDKITSFGSIGGILGSEQTEIIVRKKLDAGKEENSNYFLKLSQKEKGKYLKMLESFRQHDLVAYLIGRQQTGSPVHPNAASSTQSNLSVPQQLRELQSLKDDGVITENEFREKKKQLLERM